jgi:deoxyadenosine/deoxycytidine kinase
MTNDELDLYFEYFARLHRDLHRPDKVICFVVPQVGTLLERIKMRGRAEEAKIDVGFLEGLNGYYTAFPTICAQKYGLDVLKVDVSNLDIRSGQGKEELLDTVRDFFAA